MVKLHGQVPAEEAARLARVAAKKARFEETFKPVTTPPPPPPQETPTPTREPVLPTPTERFRQIEAEQQPGPIFKPQPRQVQDPQAYYDDQKRLIDILQGGQGFPKPTSIPGDFPAFGPDQAEAEAWANIHWAYWQAEGVLGQFQEFAPEEYEQLLKSAAQVTVASPAGDPLRALTGALQEIEKERGEDFTSYLATDEGASDLMGRVFLLELAPEVRQQMTVLAPGQTLGPLAREHIPGRLGEFVATTLEVGLDPMLWGAVAVFPPAGLAAKGAMIGTISVGASGGEQVGEAIGVPPWVGGLAGAVALPTGFGIARGFLGARQGALTARAQAAQHEAFLGGAKKVFHGTTESAAEGIRGSTFMRPTSFSRGTFKGVYVAESESVARSASEITGRAARQTPAVLGMEIPADLRIATEVHELAVRRALKVPGSSPGDMQKVQAELVNRGFGGMRISGGRLVIFDETMVRLAGLEAPSLTPAPLRGRPPKVLPAERGETRLMPEAPTMGEMEVAISGTPMARRIYRRIHQVTGRLPILGKAHIPINPSALLTEPFRKPVVAYNALLDSLDANVRQGLMYLYRLGNPFKIDKNGFVTNITSKPGAKGRHINDVLERGETWFTFSPAQRRWRNIYARLIDEAQWDYRAAGGDPKLIGFAEGEHYIPRQVISKSGIDKIRRALTGDRKIGGKRGFERPRLHEYAMDFVAEGGVYATDPLAILQTTLNAIRHSTADVQLINALAQEGVKATKLVPASVLAAPKLANTAWRNMAKLEVFLRNPAARKPAFKDPNLIAIRDQARKVWDDLRAGKITQQEARDAVAPLRAEVSAAKLALRDTRIAANREVERRLEIIRGTFIAQEGGAIPPQAFHFPEDSFAVGQLGGARWPQLRDVILPEPILREVERVVGDAGQSWARMAQKIGDIQRTMGAGADLNFPFLQGLPVLARNPKAWASAYVNSMKTVGRPQWGAEYMMRQANKYPEIWNDYLRYTRQLGEQEWFQSARQGGVVHAIPGARQFYGRIGMSFDTFLDVGRWHWFRSMHAIAAREGPHGLEQLGAVVRNGTGTQSTRGLGIGLTQRQIEGGFLFFSPRYTRSAFALLFDAMQGGIRGSEARLALTNLMAGGMTIYTGTALALGHEPILDITDPGFMSLRIGDNWVGLPGIMRAMVRTTGFSIDAAKEDPSAFYDPRKILDNPVFRFWRSRASPTVNRPFDLITGRDFIGRPTRSDWGDFAELARGSLTPFVVDTALESKGSLTTRATAIIGEYFLGRSTPVSPYQVRNEGVFKWAEEKGLVVHDLEGRPFTPAEYGQLPESLRNQFNEEQPGFTNEIIRWRLENARAWAQLDELSAQTEKRLNLAGDYFRDTGDGDGYKQRRANIFEDDRRTKERFFEENPVDLEPKTKEQKWVRDYQKEVVEAAVVAGEEAGLEQPDFELMEELDRLWRRKNGEDAGRVIDREYAASLDPTDKEFRVDRIFLMPYWELLDGVWSEEGIEAAGGLPNLVDGRTAYNFRSPREYVLALRTEMYQDFIANGLPTGLRGLKTSSAKDAPTLGERFGTKPMSSEKAQEAAQTVAFNVTREFYAFRTNIRNNFLEENSEYLKPLVRWGYMDNVPLELEPFLD